MARRAKKQRRRGKGPVLILGFRNLSEAKVFATGVRLGGKKARAVGSGRDAAVLVSSNGR